MRARIFNRVLGLAALALLVGRDAQNDVDACSALGRAPHEETPDDQLPVATGGVAEA